MALTKVSGTGLKDDCITSAHMSAVITNADIASNAAIALSKLGTSGTASSSNFLRGDGAWAAAGVSDGDKGDITVSSSGSSWVIDNNVVNEAKLQVSNSGSDYQFLQKVSGNSGGLTWASIGGARTVSFDDDVKASWGDQDDLDIWHNGTDSYITSDTGGLVLTAQTFLRLRPNGGADGIAVWNNGAVQLSHANQLKLATTSTGVTVTGTCTATAFAGDGSNLTGISGTTINNNANNRIITGSGTANTLEGESKLTFDGNTLYCDGALSFTHDSNDQVNFNSTSSWAVARFQISGTNRGYISVGANTVYVGNNTDGSAIKIKGDSFQFTPNDSNWYDILTTNSTINDSTKLPLAGGSMTGNLTLNDNKKVRFGNDGDATCEYNSGSDRIDIYLSKDVLIDYAVSNSAGTVKMNRDVLFGDHTSSYHKRCIFGNSNDLQIYHDGTHSKLVNSTGDLHLASNNAVKILGGSDLSEVQAVFNDNGSCELYYNNTKAFETTDLGVKIQKEATIIGVEDGDARLYMYADEADDNADKWQLGAATQGHFYLQNYKDGGWENSLKCNGGGNVELYCNDKLKFYTDGSGSGTIVYDDEHSSTTSLVFRLRKNASGTSTSVRQHMMSFSVPGNNRGLAQSGSSATEAPIWAGYSDYRVKTNFRPYTGGWDAIKAIPVQLYDEDQPNYEPFDPASNQTNKKGWKAHEVQAVMPEAVTGEKDAVVTQAMIDAGEYKQEQLGNIIPQYLGTTAMIPTIIGALQQAMEKIETLETKVAVLEAA